MNTIKYIILGIIQGLTEPLPISSSGHTFILRNIFNLGANDLNFEIIVNFGSLLAILLIYKDDLIKLINHFFKYLTSKTKEYKSDFNYAVYVVIGTIPVGIIGYLFKNKIESILSNTKIIGISFLITALFLFLIKKIKGNKTDKDLTLKDSIFIGIVETIALIPGISRSGSTLIAGLFRKLDTSTALKYSFMLYIPISVGTTILGIKDILTITDIHNIILPYGLGFIASFIVSFYTLRWFIKLVKNNNLIYFSIYCLITGTLILLFI